MSKSKIPDEEHPLNLVDAPKSTQDQYYKYMLRQEKIKNVSALNARSSSEGGQFLSGEEGTALSGVNEREKLLLKTLARLYLLSDTSPEYLQVKSVVGGGDREDIAEKLVDKFMETEIVKDITDRFVAPDSGRQTLSGGRIRTRAAYDAFGGDQ